MIEADIGSYRLARGVTLRAALTWVGQFLTGTDCRRSCHPTVPTAYPEARGKLIHISTGSYAPLGRALVRAPVGGGFPAPPFR